MGEMAARDDLEGQGEGIMDEERDTGMAAMSRKVARAYFRSHPEASGIMASGIRRG